MFPWTWYLKIFSYFSTFLWPISIALLLTLHASYSKRSAVTPPAPSTNNLAMVNLVMVKNIILCSNLSITVIKQNFWKKGHPVATYPLQIQFTVWLITHISRQLVYWFISHSVNQSLFLSASQPMSQSESQHIIKIGSWSFVSPPVVGPTLIQAINQLVCQLIGQSAI